MDYKITKIAKYGKGLYSSEKIGLQWYHIVYAHVYADSTHKTGWRVKFLHMFDAEDVASYMDLEPGEAITDEHVRTVRDEYAYACAESYIGSAGNIHEVIENCNDSITRYA